MKTCSGGKTTGLANSQLRRRVASSADCPVAWASRAGVMKCWPGRQAAIALQNGPLCLRPVCKLLHNIRCEMPRCAAKTLVFGPKIWFHAFFIYDNTRNMTSSQLNGTCSKFQTATLLTWAPLSAAMSQSCLPAIVKHGTLFTCNIKLECLLHSPRLDHGNVRGKELSGCTRHVSCRQAIKARLRSASASSTVSGFILGEACVRSKRCRLWLRTVYR